MWLVGNGIGAILLLIAIAGIGTIVSRRKADYALRHRVDPKDDPNYDPRYDTTDW